MRISLQPIRFQMLQVMLVCLIAAWSCVDPISFETDSIDSQLVFFGTFSQLNQTHMFRISQSADFGKPVIPVSGASVVISDDQGNSAEYLEVMAGEYELKTEGIPGIPGRSYHVEITLADGRAFCSTPQVMPEPIEVEDIYFEINQKQTVGSSDLLVEQTFIEIFVDTPLENHSGISSGLRWDIEEAYSFSDLQCHPFYDAGVTCYFNIPVEPGLQIFKSEDGAQQNLRGFKVHSRILAPDDEFVERHFFSVYQYTITDEAYQYWEKVKIVTNQSGNLFDFPPAGIEGNIYENNHRNSTALGFFEVSGLDIARVYTLPFLIGPQIMETCPISRTFIVQDKCCFCWLLDEAENRIERPNYWNDD